MKNLRRMFISFMGLVIFAELCLCAILWTRTHRQQIEAKGVAEQHKQVQMTQDQRYQKMQQQLKTSQAQVQGLKTQIVTLQHLYKPPAGDWKILKAEATAYSPFDNRDGRQGSRSGSVRTSLGLTPGPKIMAVDPKRVPYGSHLVVIYPDGHFITGIAGDTGGALRRSSKVVVDVFARTYSDAIAHGRKDVIVLYK